MKIDDRVTLPNCTIEELFRLITRWDLLLPKIDPSILQLTMKPPEGPVAPGTVFFERMKMMGRIVEITATMRALRPPTGYDYDATSDGLTGGGTMTLRDPGNGSVEFHVDIDLDPTTLALWIVTALFGWKSRAAERARLARMRGMLSSGALVPPAPRARD